MATTEEAISLLELVGAWKVFKKTHNYRDAKLQCCENTRRLFDKLDNFETIIVRNVEKKGSDS
jgi:hypothetical protein